MAKTKTKRQLQDEAKALKADRDMFAGQLRDATENVNKLANSLNTVQMEASKLTEENKAWKDQYNKLASDATELKKQRDWSLHALGMMQMKAAGAMNTVTFTVENNLPVPGYGYSENGGK